MPTDNGQIHKMNSLTLNNEITRMLYDWTWTTVVGSVSVEQDVVVQHKQLDEFALVLDHRQTDERIRLR